MLERTFIKKLLICFKLFNNGFVDPLVEKVESNLEANITIIEIILKNVNNPIDKRANFVANESFSLHRDKFPALRRFFRVF